MPTVTLRILAGLALLTLGRKLFWLFVGLVGFAAGIVLATQFVQGPEWMVLLIALAAGLVGVLFALVLQQAAVALAGFLAGGYVVMSLLNGLVGWDPRGPYWALYWALVIVGGIASAALVLALFEWALIILSSLTGAFLIVQTIHPDPLLAAILTAVLFIAGVVIQAGLRRRAQPPPAPPVQAG